MTVTIDTMHRDYVIFNDIDNKIINTVRSYVITILPHITKLVQPYINDNRAIDYDNDALKIINSEIKKNINKYGCIDLLNKATRLSIAMSIAKNMIKYTRKKIFIEDVIDYANGASLCSRYIYNTIKITCNGITYKTHIQPDDDLTGFRLTKTIVNGDNIKSCFAKSSTWSYTSKCVK